MAYYNIGDALNELANLGVFDYVLPFLLIFALVYGILSSMKLFRENRAVDGIIALSVGLMALQFGKVPEFFSVLFPNVGIALSIVLAVLIIAGFFVDPKKVWIMYTLLGLSAAVALIVLIQTSADIGWGSAYWWSDNWPIIAFVVFLLAAIGIIMGGGKHKEHPDEYKLGFWRRPEE